MDRLVQAVAAHVRGHIVAAVSRLLRQDGEIRTVFHGPPMEILRPVFLLLTEDDGIDSKLANGDVVRVPVLLQVDRLEAGAANPKVGKSGICDATHLIDLRNSPAACPRFVALVEPGHLASLSFSSASDDFGLSAHSNSGTATTTEWWRDGFVQSLVGGALDRHVWPSGREREYAQLLIEKAVLAADKIDKNVASRHGAWRVLSRVWSISDPRAAFGTQLSLACGFPPHADGSVDAPAQEQIINDLSERFVDSGFKSTIDELKQFGSDVEQKALDEFLLYVQDRCGVAPRFGHAPPFYYEPSGGSSVLQPPSWWVTLTVETWRRLLDGDDDPPPPPGAHLKFVCLNPIVPKIKGTGPIVASDVQLSVINESGLPAPDEVTISRDSAGTGNHREWTLKVGSGSVLTDRDVPKHRTPVRYSVDGTGVKKTTMRIVSLSTWEPGLVVYSRTATKMSLPKRVARKTENVAYDLTLSLSGQGRHYFDVYVRPGVTLGDAAKGSGDDGSVDERKSSPIGRVGETDAYGFEVEASGDCFYQFEVTRDPEDGPELFRVYLTCDEAAPEQCSSEFERLIRLNRPRGSARASTDVHVNRQLRCADLQGWALAKEHAAHSFRPFVLGPDYAAVWRARDWSATQPEETVFSNGHFLHDPRPGYGEMAPPSRFVQVREALFDRIRGADDNGLTEAAPIGEWLATDATFAQLVEEYVETYSAWLEASPDAAAWCDVGIVAALEPDGSTLVQEPDAVLMSPMHPVRFAWHCLAQRALFLSQRKLPCPAASILDPDAIPDALVLPMRTASGGVKHQVFFSVECSSDYWAILWNGSKLAGLPHASTRPPFDKEFGVLVGGVSSGFSSSQVARALDDVADIFAAKPLLNIAVSSAAGQNNACNEGLLSWCRGRFGYSDDSKSLVAMGPRFVQVIDERSSHARPEDAEVSNLAEDTGNAVRWLEKKQDGTVRPDLTIIAQLETSNPGGEQVAFTSPLGPGGLIRHRVRQQLSGGQGAFLSESRMASPRGPTGDGLADKTANAMVRLENLGDIRYGYTFAPSVHAIRAALDRSDYAAVSSSAVDPACFLGGWLQDMYLWDYELPSYSHRSGDSNGYYLLSKVKALDRETLHGVLSKLPGCDSLADELIEEVILEVARRGIPTVRGLSRGDSGASGDLGLFVTSRVIQDDFRVGQSPGGLLPVLKQEGTNTELALLIPVDPFRGYIDDLARAVGRTSFQRPDLLVAGIVISDSRIACRLTPIEVKYRGKEPMPPVAAQEALQQAKAFSELLLALRAKADDPDLVAWKLAFQHLVSSMLGFGLRVYSQQRVAANQAAEWALIHARIVKAVLSEELEIDIDERGRLVILDGSPASDARDSDGDGFRETIVINRGNASSIVKGDTANIYAGLKARVGEWMLMPRQDTAATKAPATSSPPAPEAPEVIPSPVTPPVGRTGAVPAVVGIAEPTVPSRLIPAASAITQAAGNGIDLLVGHTVDGFQPEMRRLNLSDTNLNQLNIGVVGDLGTGKTQLLKSLVHQIVASRDQNRGIQPRFLIFDYKKDYSSEEFVQAVGARVVKPQHLPINLFDVAGAGDSMTPWLDRFKFFADVLDKIFSGVGPVQRQQLKTAVRQAYEQCTAAGRQPTIYDVHANYRAILGTKTDSPLAIIDDLVDMEMFSPEPSSAEGVNKFLDGVVVVSLHSLGQDDRTKNMLVAIMLNMFYEHMLRIPKRPFVGDSPQQRVVDSFLLVDEADNIMRYEFDVLRKILLQGREFGVGVVLASQYLRHFKTGATDYREPLLSWFIHKVPNIVPQELGALGLAGNVAHLTERIKTLGKHECLFKTYNVPGEIVKGVPFYSLIQGK